MTDSEKELLAAKTEVELLRAQVKFLEALSASNEALMKYWKQVASDLHYERNQDDLPSITCFYNLPEGTTHIGPVSVWTVPCSGFRARFYAYKKEGDKILTYLTDSDDEFGGWVDRAQIFRNAPVPKLYPIKTQK